VGPARGWALRCASWRRPLARGRGSEECLEFCLHPLINNTLLRLAARVPREPPHALARDCDASELMLSTLVPGLAARIASLERVMSMLPPVLDTQNAPQRRRPEDSRPRAFSPHASWVDAYVDDQAAGFL
jgi:hypothetical protein